MGRPARPFHCLGELGPDPGTLQCRMLSSSGRQGLVGGIGQEGEDLRDRPVDNDAALGVSHADSLTKRR